MTPLLLIILFTLQAADYLTTRRILSLGGYERNPVVRWLMSGLGGNAGLFAAKALVAVLGIIGALLLHWIAPFVLASLCLFYGFIIRGNLRVIERLRD